MGLDLNYSHGQTALDENEIEGLLIPGISTRSDLDEFEQQNIEKAMQWTLMHSFKFEQVFSIDFICKIHTQMYSDVWEWAGEFRKTNKNIGIDKSQIQVQLRVLLDDLKYWHSNNTYLPDELAIQFKHRLVSIHCCSNGNGRHSRLLADIIIEKIYKLSIFSWGSNQYASSESARREYIKALKSADTGDYKLLLKFARS